MLFEIVISFFCRCPVSILFVCFDFTGFPFMINLLINVTLDRNEKKNERSK